MSSGFNVGFSSVASVIVGGGLTVYSTYAELAATSAEDGDLGLVASGTSGQPRLFRYATDTWVPDEPVVWSVDSSGSTGERALRTAAGAAIWHGDRGQLSDGSVLYAVVDDDRQVVWVPAVLSGGVRLGVTHEATPIHFELFRDPTTNATSVGETANTTIDYDTTVADRMAIYAGTGAADNAVLTYAVTIPADAAGYVIGVLGCDVTQTSNATFVVSLYPEISGSLRRYEIAVDNGFAAGQNDKWMWIVNSATGAVGNYKGQAGDLATVEQDRLWYIDTDGDGYVYQDYPTPTGVAASEDTDTVTGVSWLTTTGSARLQVVARDSSPNPTRATLEGFFAIAIEAI